MTISDYKTKTEIKKIVQKLGSNLMMPKSHGYNENIGKTIIEAAKIQADHFLNQVDERNSAISLMAVILAANRNYNRQVDSHVKNMRQRFPKITFLELQDELDNRDYEEFRDIWGHKDEKKYNILASLVKRILSLQRLTSWEDLELMKNWAQSAKLKYRKEDILLGGVPNVGIATFQHLRMSFGADTVKPDQRVKEVLSKEFNAALHDEDVIEAIEDIAKITGHKVIVIDQIFVKYGSGYYLQN